MNTTTQSSEIGYREVYSLVLEALSKKGKGTFDELINEVFRLGEEKGTIQVPSGRKSSRMESSFQPEIPGQYKSWVGELVRQAMWECLIKGLLIFGSDEYNPMWPFFRITDHGNSVVSSQPPQPYDPDGFIQYFEKHVPDVDHVVKEYLIEAVHSFNSGCNKASAVMMGCASEKLILLLIDKFQYSISDAAEKEKIKKKFARNWTISHKYNVLKEYLDRIISARNIPREHIETISSELPAGFELLRRIRNVGGHPDIPGEVDADTVFLNLRTFVEYAKRVVKLIDFFSSNKVEL